jgi:hypothetical protein
MATTNGLTDDYLKSLPKETTDFFNNFIEDSLDISFSSATNDLFVSHFEKYIEDKESARLLAGSVIYTCLLNGIELGEMYEKIRKMPLGESDAYLAMILNFNRVKTSAIGVINKPVTSEYVKRMILM